MIGGSPLRKKFIYFLYLVAGQVLWDVWLQLLIGGSNETCSYFVHSCFEEGCLSANVIKGGNLSVEHSCFPKGIASLAPIEYQSRSPINFGLSLLRTTWDRAHLHLVWAERLWGLNDGGQGGTGASTLGCNSHPAWFPRTPWSVDLALMTEPLPHAGQWVLWLHCWDTAPPITLLPSHK